MDDSGITGAILKVRRDVLFSETVCFSCTDGTDTETSNSIVISVSCGESNLKFTQPTGFVAVQAFALGDTSAKFSWTLFDSLVGTSLCTTDYVVSKPPGSSWG